MGAKQLAITSPLTVGLGPIAHLSVEPPGRRSVLP